MHLDMANYTIQQMRPYLKEQSVTYERKKFEEFLIKQEGMICHTNILWGDTCMYILLWLDFSISVCAATGVENISLSVTHGRGLVPALLYMHMKTVKT